MQAGSPTGISARVPWLDYRASPPDERTLPRDQDVFAGELHPWRRRTQLSGQRDSGRRRLTFGLHLAARRFLRPGPQAATWYLSNHGLRDLLTNFALMRRLHNDSHHYWRWSPGRGELDRAGVPAPPHFDDVDATLKLSAWRTALASYAFCPRPWVVQEARCRLRALGLEPNK